MHPFLVLMAEVGAEPQIVIVKVPSSHFHYENPFVFKNVLLSVMVMEVSYSSVASRAITHANSHFSRDRSQTVVEHEVMGIEVFKSCVKHFVTPQGVVLEVRK